MKKNKILTSIVGIPTLCTCLMPLASCKNKNTPIVAEQCTVHFSAIDGVTLEGTTSITINKGTKWSEIEKPHAIFDETNLIMDAGWFDETNQQYMFRLSDDFVIEQDMTFTYHILTEDNKTTISFLDKDSQSISFQHEVIKGSSWKAVKSLLGSYIEPEPIENYQFKNWLIDSLPVDDSYVFVGEGTQLKPKWLWTGPCIEFSHSDNVSWVGIPKIKLELNQPTTWKQLVEANKLPKVEYDDTEYTPLGWVNWKDKTILSDNDTTIINSDFRARYMVYPNHFTDKWVKVTFNEVIQYMDWDEEKKEPVPSTKTVTYQLNFPSELSTGQKTNLYDFIKFYEFDKVNNPNYNREGLYKDAECKDKITDPHDVEINDTATNNVFYLKLNLKSFCTDSWVDVVSAASGGLDYLLHHYKETNVIGLERIIVLDGHSYKVRVIGQNHEDRADGSGKAALTFELEELISKVTVPQTESEPTIITPLTTPLSWDNTGHLSKKNIEHILNQTSGTVCWYENGSELSKTCNKSCLVMGLESSDKQTQYLFKNIKLIKRPLDVIGDESQYASTQYNRVQYFTKLFIPNLAEVSDETSNHPIGPRYDYYYGNSHSILAKKYLDSYTEWSLGNVKLIDNAVSPKYWMYQSDGVVGGSGYWCDIEKSIAINEYGNKTTQSCTDRKQMGVSFCFCI